MIKQKLFEKTADYWKTLKQLPWNRMRYELTNDILLNSISTKNISILNVGCGDGIETFLLDNIAAEHTLVDYSQNMLDEAESFLKENNFTSQYTLIQSDIKEIKEKVDRKFDLILFHNVIEYIENPLETINDLKELLNDNGLLSLRHLNRYANICAPASFENNLDKVEEYLNDSSFLTSFGIRSNTYTGEEILDFLQQSGFHHIDRYGLMSLNNFIINNEIKHDTNFYNKQLKLEQSMSQQFPYMHIARFGLFLCRK